jgi:hypothetical protein
MNVGLWAVAAQFLFLGIFVSNFRYCVFAVWSTILQNGGTCRNIVGKPRSAQMRVTVGKAVDFPTSKIKAVGNWP